MLCEVSIKAIPNIPDILPNDDINFIICESIALSNIELVDGDIICVAHKIFSKAEGCIINLSNVKPSEKALYYAKKLNKDPRKVQVILNESKNVIRYFKHSGQNEGVMICEHKLGFISANAGVDQSNIEGIDNVITLPKDPDLSSSRLRVALETKFNTRIGVVMTDTFGRPWRIGQVNIAIGLAGVPATIKEQGNKDAYGRPLLVTEPAFSDEISAASGLLANKSGKKPVILFRGLKWQEKNSNARDILRIEREDVFK